MYVRAFGADYYLDEKSFAERMTQAAENHPWRMKEIVAIQHQMKEAEDRIFDYIAATTDPLETLRRHIDDMVAAGEIEKQI